MREDYNADWEQAVIDAAMEQAALADHRRERTQQTAGGSGETGDGHAGDSVREHFQERAGPSPTPANDNAPDGPSANKRRALLQNRQMDELIEVGRGHNAQRTAHEERLRETYDTSAYREELRSLERKRFILPWHRTRMEELRLTLGDAQRRHEQALESFTNAQAREIEQIRERHARERLELEREIERHPEWNRESEQVRKARMEMEQAEQTRTQQRTRRIRRSWE